MTFKKQSKLSRIRRAYNEGLTKKEAYKRFKKQIGMDYIQVAYSDFKHGRLPLKLKNENQSK